MNNDTSKTADEEKGQEEHPPPTVAMITVDMMQDDPNTIPLSEQPTGEDEEDQEDEEEDLDTMLANLGAYFSS